MIILHTCVTICGLFMNSIADIIPLYHAVSLKLDDSFSFSVVIIVARFSRQPWSERAVMNFGYLMHMCTTTTPSLWGRTWGVMQCGDCTYK